MTPNIPMYVISLAKDSARLKSLSSRFPEYASSLKLVEAVDGRELPAQEYFQNINIAYQTNERILSPSEVGCTLSHIRALETFLLSKEDKAIIFEDDIEGSDKDIRSAISNVATLAEDGVLILGGQQGLRSQAYLIGRKLSNSEIFRLAPVSYNHVMRTCCYAVTRKTALRILEIQKKELNVADAWGKILRKSNIEIYFSNIFSHPEDLSDSHIQADRSRIFDDGNLKKSLFSKIEDKLKRRKIKILILIHLLAGYRRLI